MRLFAYLITILSGAVLIYGASHFPDWGSPDAPASVHVSPRFIEKGMEETEVPNMVTAVLADYRGFDTLGETTVIFTSAIACILILGNPKKKEKEP